VILMKKKTGRILKETVFYIVITVTALIFVAPIIWMLLTSLQPYKNLIEMRFRLFDSSLETYISLFAKQAFLRAFRASMIITLFSSFVTMIVSILTAYAAAFFNFKGKNAVVFGTLSIQMAPAIVLMIPLYILVSKVGLAGSFTGIILVFVLFLAPMTTWMLRGFFNDIPRALFDSALIDGCSRTQFIFRIILPIVRPGLAATFIFSFITAWNEVLIPLILSNSTTSTLTMYAASFTTTYEVDYAGLAATGIFTSIPSIILVIMFNKQLIEGLIEGAVKG